MISVTVETVAMIAHELNRNYCRIALDDMSQPRWSQAPDWQRASAINGVRFHLDTPDAGPAASHENWLSEKEAEGWVYGAVKNPEKKEHPCMVPYAALPLEQRIKDSLFIAVVHAMRPLCEITDKPREEA